MKNIIVSALLIIGFSNFANAKTIWHEEDFPNGLSTLTGVFDKNGTGIMFGCTGDFLAAGAIILNKKDKIQNISPTSVSVSTSDNQSVEFSADAVPSAENNYTFMSSDNISSLTTFHFLDEASNTTLHISLENNDIPLTGNWDIQTKGAEKSVAKFKKSCRILSDI